MTIGAQLFSLRKQLKTPEEIGESFRKLKQMGYENVQVSGIGAIDPVELKAISDEYRLPVVCTHTPWTRIIEETDRVIEEHRLLGCSEIGLGMMDKSFRGSEEGLNAFLAQLKEPVSKISEAGLHFAYHNHAFEFDSETPGGPCYFDSMIERCPDWHFILDVYWVAYAGKNPADYIRRLGGEKIPNIHFKDMAKSELREICPIGMGRTDFAALGRVCTEVGVKNLLVEQDNATDDENPFGDMEFSLRSLRALGL